MAVHAEQDHNREVIFGHNREKDAQNREIWLPRQDGPSNATFEVAIRLRQRRRPNAGKRIDSCTLEFFAVKELSPQRRDGARSRSIAKAPGQGQSMSRLLGQPPPLAFVQVQGRRTTH